MVSFMDSHQIKERKAEQSRATGGAGAGAGTNLQASKVKGLADKATSIPCHAMLTSNLIRSWRLHMHMQIRRCGCEVSVGVGVDSGGVS
ncbi:hypothetical protein BofuT4_uP080930.1 [Botrytis cinerea T4]|uniref:Uncharacterized protein n=1 Tax=Botryotinia fuckeliana (strain T4) TaxID=999810 RepID=G2YL00_BOTF4|nr:hypothetical protein BofuT4_uP080930.1 [Botrytis cinerea T4]